MMKPSKITEQASYIFRTAILTLINRLFPNMLPNHGHKWTHLVAGCRGLSQGINLQHPANKLLTNH